MLGLQGAFLIDSGLWVPLTYQRAVQLGPRGGAPLGQMTPLLLEAKCPSLGGPSPGSEARNFYIEVPQAAIPPSGCNCTSPQFTRDWAGELWAPTHHKPPCTKFSAPRPSDLVRACAKRV